VSFFAIFAFVIFGGYRSKRNPFDKTADDGAFFSHHQVAATSGAAYPDNGSLDDDFIQIQQCHIGCKVADAADSAKKKG
jgi:hypothetical protein